MRAFVLPTVTQAFALMSVLVPSVAFAQYGQPQSGPHGSEEVYVDSSDSGAPSPGYGGQPYGGYGGLPPSYSPPPPPEPERTGPRWNVRFNPFDLIEGRASFGVDYAIIGPITIGLAPSYVYGVPVYISDDVNVDGWALAVQPGFWISSEPYRGLGFKLHLEHESVRYRVTTQDGSEEKKSLGLTKVGAMLVSESVYGGFFSISYGLGLKKNVTYDEAKHSLTCPGSPAGSNDCIVASGIGKGWEIIGELGLGVVF